MGNYVKDFVCSRYRFLYKQDEVCVDRLQSEIKTLRAVAFFPHSSRKIMEKEIGIN